MNKRALVVLPVLGLAAAGLFLALRSRPVPPPRILHPTTQQAALAQKHMESLQEQFIAPATPSLHAQTPRTLRISEDDLNVYLASSRSARKLLLSRGVQAVQITLQEPSNLSLRASVAVQGRPRNVQLDGTLAADPKLGLRFSATHVQVGRFPLPPAVVTAQANALAKRFERQMAGRLPLAIQSVQVQGKQLVLTGIPVIRPPKRVAAIPR